MAQAAMHVPAIEVRPGLPEFGELGIHAPRRDHEDVERLALRPRNAIHLVQPRQIGVDVRLGDEGGRILLKLVKEAHGWRIDDVKDDDQAWLRKQLNDEIRDLRHTSSH